MTSVLPALLLDDLPEVVWQHGDDLCDCQIQRIGMWTIPYIAESLHIRFCCVWAELLEDYPQFVMSVPAYLDSDTELYVTQETLDWDSTTGDMPRALWYRQLAKRTGKPLDRIRQEYYGQDPPKAVSE